MHRLSFQCWRVFFLILLWTHVVFFSDIRRFSSSPAFSFSGPFIYPSLVHFKNGTEYLTKGGGKPWCLSLWWGSCCWVKFREAFLLVWDILLLFCLYLCLIVSASNIPKLMWFIFSPSILILSWFGCSLPSVICLFSLFIMSIEHFSMPNSIDCIFLLFVLESLILFPFLQTTWCRPCTSGGKSFLVIY